MALKFALNISTVFDEKVPFLERFNLAKNLGFKYVEAQDIYDYTVEEIKQEKPADLQQILINSPSYDRGGLACVPGEEMRFCRSISNALKYAVELDCKRIHVLAGIKPANFTPEELEDCYINNLLSVAESLEENGILGLIEPICPEVKENYFLSNFDQAIELLRKLESDNYKLLLDVYHLYKINGDVASFNKYLPYAGHIQISQDPGRKEPFFPGNIPYHEVLRSLKDCNYQEFIGLEYFPSGSVEEGIQFVKDYI